MTDGLKAKHRAAIIAALAANERVERAVLFGSRAMGTNTVTSDVDIALFGQHLTLTDQATLAATCDELPMAQSVDLLLHNTIDNPALVKHIRTHGVEWYRRVGGGSNESGVKLTEPVHTKLGSCVNLIRDTVQPSDVPNYPYIGLEHIGEGSLHLIGQGNSNDVESAKSKFQEGDTLFGKLRPYFRKVARASFNGICSTDIWVIRSKNGIDQRYIHYCLASQHFVDFVSQRSEGTRMPRANWQCAAKYEINLPSLPEQRAIAHILGTLDDKIELNRRMNQTLEAMAQAIFKDWFVDFGPVKAKMQGRNPYLPAEIWELFPDALNDEDKPTGWEVKPLNDVAEFLNGLALQKFPAYNSEDSLPVIKIAELRNGITKKSNRASHNIPLKYIVKDGDFLFSWSGSLVARFWTGSEGALNQHLFKVTSDHYPVWFFSQWIYHHLKGFQEIAASKTTTMGHIQREHLREATTNCPPDDVLSVLGESIAPLVERTILNELENRSLAQMRNIILPKLISGELRVSDIEKVMEVVKA